MKKFISPVEIENESMRIIGEELDKMGIVIPEDRLSVVKRVIHTTADFDFAENLTFSDGAVSSAVAALKSGVTIVTDTNMTLSGIKKAELEKHGCKAKCYMADPDVAQEAKEKGITRAVCSVKKAVTEDPGCIYAVGNAPTALFALAEAIENGFRPALIIGVPVGFVNVTESKEEIIETCATHNIPFIVARGRKGGSTVSCAICNALLLAATK